MSGPKHLQRSTMEVIVPPGTIMRTLSLIGSDLQHRRLIPSLRKAMRGLWRVRARELRSHLSAEATEGLSAGAAGGGNSGSNRAGGSFPGAPVPTRGEMHAASSRRLPAQTPGNGRRLRRRNAKRGVLCRNSIGDLRRTAQVKVE